MKMRKCPNCGSNIELRSVECEYCGSSFVEESSSQQNLTNEKVVKVPKISKKKLQELLIDKRVNAMYLPSIIFSVIWTIAAILITMFVRISITNFEATSGMDTGSDIMMLLPIGFVVLGIGILFFTLKSAINKVDKSLNQMYRKGDIQGAYDYMKEIVSYEETNKMGLYLHDLIIIEFYVKKNIARVREYILEIEFYPKEISPEVNKISTKLGMSLINVVRTASIEEKSKTVKVKMR